MVTTAMVVLPDLPWLSRPPAVSVLAPGQRPQSGPKIIGTREGRRRRSGSPGTAIGTVGGRARSTAWAVAGSKHTPTRFLPSPGPFPGSVAQATARPAAKSKIKPMGTYAVGVRSQALRSVFT